MEIKDIIYWGIHNGSLSNASIVISGNPCDNAVTCRLYGCRKGNSVPYVACGGVLYNVINQGTLTEPELFLEERRHSLQSSVAVESVEHLKDLLSSGRRAEFYIDRDGYRETMVISYRKGLFRIINRDDGTRQRLSEESLMRTAYTDIGQAIGQDKLRFVW